MPPPAAAEPAVAQFADLLAVLLLDPLLHPAASTAQPSAAATATLVFLIRTFSPSELHDRIGSGTRASSREKVNKRYLGDFQSLSDR
jgi:hypothetical protein